jgi:excisionase family DNA binding protein
MSSIEILKPPEAAAYLRIAIPTLRKWTTEGRFKHVRLGGKVLYLKNDLNNYILSNVIQARKSSAVRGESQRR